MKLTKPVLCAMALALAGCVNPYAKYFNERRPGVPLAPPSAYAELRTVESPADVEEVKKQGFVCVGESSFRGAGRIKADGAKEQAKRIGADIVLLRVRYLGAYSSTYTLPDYHPPQTYGSSFSGSAVTGGGAVNYSGYVTTTAPGYVSYHQETAVLHTYSYRATYWRKTATAPEAPAELTDEQVGLKH